MGNESIDTDALKARTDIITVIERHVELNRRGGEWYGICPFHDDHKSSLQVNEPKQIYKCFACGAGGDSIDFLSRLGYSFQEACEEIAGGNIQAGDRQPAQRPTKKREQPKTQVIPAPTAAKKHDATHRYYGKPVKVYRWPDADGRLIGYTLRFKQGDGGKAILPLTYHREDGKEGWRFKGFDAPRPLYNLPALTAEPGKTVLIVEGEKAAEAAARLFPAATATTWIGGSKAIGKTYWRPLYGRNVILWPDNDEPGEAAMIEIARELAPHGGKVKWVPNPPAAPEHWDIADAEWTPEQARAYAKKNLTNPPGAEPEPPPPAESKPEPPPAEEESASPYDADFKRFKPDDEHIGSKHFKFLGYDKTEGNIQAFYFYAREPKTTVRLTASQFTKTHLMTLAPLNWWEESFPTKTGFDINAAANWIIQTGNAVGPFKEKYLRGRGAWMDRARVVLHGGDMLVIDGKPHPIGLFDSRFIYEAAESLEFNTRNPLTCGDAARLLEIMDLINWKRPVNGLLLAGWCVIAPICGALNWRPHVWLTGAAGTGKSWVFQNIVRRMLGETCLAVQSETTEAGLRQLLQHDALPVVFDEAEGEDRKSAERMDNILALMRAASADDGGIMAKGTSGGTAKTYSIRSCFAFASISVQVKHQSDRGRVTILELTKIPDPSYIADGETAEQARKRRWEKLQRLYAATVTDEFAAGLQARTIRMIPVILENARTFAAAAAAVLGEQRAGDQLGALLAGAYSLRSDGLTTFDKAKEWIEGQDWNEERGIDETRDEMALFQRLMEQITRVELDRHSAERSVGEIVQVAYGRGQTAGFQKADAREHLQRIGFDVAGEHIFVSNTADWIRSRLRNTGWSANHNKILLRLKGAEPVGAVRFGSGIETRAVKIPIGYVVGDVPVQSGPGVQPEFFDDDAPF